MVSVKIKRYSFVYTVSFAFRNLIKKYLNHPWTTNFEIRHKSGSSSINLIMTSFHEAVSFIDLYLVIIFQELFMLYPNNHCIRMKRILLSKHCYIEYSVKATSFIILVDIKSIWAGPCETVTTLPSIETGCKEKNEHDSLLSVS